MSSGEECSPPKRLRTAPEDVVPDPAPEYPVRMVVEEVDDVSEEIPDRRSPSPVASASNDREVENSMEVAAESALRERSPSSPVASDSNDREEENAAAESAMRDFAVLTNTDEIYAQTILQDVNWNLEAALEVHFGRTDPRNNASANDEPHSSTHSPADFDISGLEVSVLSWNIDGLDGNSLNTRMKAVYCVLKRVNPDFVFLQEVTERGIEPIEKLQKYYNIYYSNRGSQYYTAILVSKVFNVQRHDVIHYRNTGMGRTLQGLIGPFKVFLLNTHLESTPEHSDKRKVQLRECFDKMSQLQRDNPEALIFFGGDLNIRDNEVPPLPHSFADAWLAAGAPAAEQYTWDTVKNDNKFSGRARCRFDRVFWSGPLNKVSFVLEGKQRIRTTMCFPSDHWAIHCTFTA